MSSFTTRPVLTAGTCLAAGFSLLLLSACREEKEAPPSTAEVTTKILEQGNARLQRMLAALPNPKGKKPEQWEALCKSFLEQLPELRSNVSYAPLLEHINTPDDLWGFWKSLLRDLKQAGLLNLAYEKEELSPSDMSSIQDISQVSRLKTQAALFRLFCNELQNSAIQLAGLTPNEALYARNTLFPSILQKYHH